jgi:hypothetical protein
MKTTKEEKIIRDMRRRWPGIVAALSMLIMFSVCLFFVIRQNIKVDELVTPEHVAAMASFDNPKAELPELFCRFHTLAGCSAKLMFEMKFFALLMGVALGYLIVQVADLTKRRLFLSMLDRIQNLEKQVKELKPQQKSDGQPGDGG